MTRRRALLARVESGGRLPAEYQEVEYLEGLGEQYIDTGMNLAGDIYGFQVDAQFTGTLGSSNEIRYICGSRSSYQDNRLTVQIQGTTAENHMRFEADNEYVLSGVSGFDRHVYKISPIGMQVDDVSYGIPIIRRSGLRFYIFNITNGSNAPIAGRYWKGRIYNIDLLGYAGNIIYTFVPCYRKQDSKPGMYDLVTNTFFTNAGTGEFVVGADVN